VEFEGAVHDGSEPDTGVAPDPGALAELSAGERGTRFAGQAGKKGLDDRTGDV
jgi:hypothetical protein